MYYQKEKVPLSKIVLIVTLILLSIVLILMVLFNIRIYKINGTSMSPTLEEKEFVLTYHTEYKRGDIIAYFHNDVVMIKRIIGLPNDTIDIKLDGTVYVNGEVLSEPYLNSKAQGDVEISLPYTVPEDKYFILGDNRADSIDSRNIHIGAISKSDIIGKVKFSLIPPKEIE